MKYDDGDKEHLSRAQLLRVLAPTKGAAKKKKRLRGET